MSGRRVLVCGGRNYSDAAHVVFMLDAAHRADSIGQIIHGGAPGADSLAAQWGRDNGVEVHSYPADWRRYGNAAGPIRNLKMLADARPDVVIAFPGGKGTAHMKRVAVAHGVRIIDVKEISPKPNRTLHSSAKVASEEITP